MNWQFVFKTKGGHKWFRDLHSGRVAVADDSGSTPDRTDEGVLWLDTSRSIRSNDGNGWHVPLLTPDGVRTVTISSQAEALALRDRFGMRITLPAWAVELGARPEDL